MKVLMFGWEFPPHISGGLGTACAGLTRALEREQVDILFTIPKLHGGEQADRTTFINASAIAIPQIKVISAIKTTGTTATHPEQSSAYRPDVVSRHEGGQTVIEIPSTLSAYTSPSAMEGAYTLKKWNYTFESGEDQIHPATDGLLAERTATSTAETRSRAVTEPYSFSGTYGRNLLLEVERYAQVASTIAGEHTFDVIHAHDWMTFPAGIAAKNISNKPLVVHVHATEVDRSGEQVNPAVFAIEKEGMMRADKVITVSNWTKNIAVRHYGIDENKIEVVHNGINPKVDGETPAFAPPLRTPVVTFLGRITHQKGPMYFVEAARKVHQQFPDVHFVVAGSGDQLPQMIERIAQHRLSDRFHFTGFLKGDDIDRVWAMSSVYVMPSVSEPFGIAPLEAIQAGVPVILSQQAGVGEVMPHAIKVDFWETDALAEAIGNVLRYKSLANTLKKNGAEELKTITWDKAAKKITTLYYELTTTNKKATKKSGTILSGSPAKPASETALF